MELNSKEIIAYNNRAERYIEIGEKYKALDDLIKHIEVDGKIEFSLDITQDNYEKFMKLLESQEHEEPLVKEVLRRFKDKEGINIVG